MEVVFALPLLLLPLFLPYVTGQMAKNFGRKFWPWFPYRHSIAAGGQYYPALFAG